MNLLECPVPDFFQKRDAESLRSQVGWSKDNLSLSNGFFERLLRVGESEFGSWLEGTEELPPGKNEELLSFWVLVLHLLSFQNLDVDAVRVFLERPACGSSDASLSYDLPWRGSTVREFLEQGGDEAVSFMNRWITSFRYG